MRKIFTFFFGLVILLAISALITIPMIKSSAKEQSFVGAWKTSCKPDSQEQTIDATIAFTSDGIVIASELPANAPFQTTSLGNWYKSEPNTATYSFMVFGGDPVGGVLFYYFKVNGVSIYDPDTDTYSGQFETHVYNPDGVEFLLVTGTCDATRITVDPMGEE